MPPIYLSEGDVTELVDMDCAVAALRSAFAEQASGGAINSPRARARYWGSRLNMMSAGLKSGMFGFKAYAGTKAPTVYHVMLYHADRGLIAIIEARRLSRLRTGAATGLATDLLAKRGRINLAMIGAGEQGAHATCRRRCCSGIGRRDRLCEESGKVARLLRRRFRCNESVGAARIERRRMHRAGRCHHHSDGFRDPCHSGRVAARHVHVNTVGANAANRMELEIATFARARLVATDDIEQARIEAGEIIAGVGSGKLAWDNVSQLSDLIGKENQQGGLTIFKSLGAALEDVALASAVYERAIAQGRGRQL